MTLQSVYNVDHGSYKPTRDLFKEAKGKNPSVLATGSGRLQRGDEAPRDCAKVQKPEDWETLQSTTYTRNSKSDAQRRIIKN